MDGDTLILMRKYNLQTLLLPHFLQLKTDFSFVIYLLLIPSGLFIAIAVLEITDFKKKAFTTS